MEGGDNWIEGNVGLKVIVVREEGYLFFFGFEV